MSEASCALCAADGGELVLRTDFLRVVLIPDADYPGFCRVILNRHVAELTDLAPAERSLLMQAVCKVETVLREVMAPDKINLATFGNMVPHLHWHVIPRYRDDAHFPEPVWAQAQRASHPARLAERAALLPLLRERLGKMRL